MELREAEMKLATHRQILGECLVYVQGVENTVTDTQRKLVGAINAMEERLRNNLGEVNAMAGSGIAPESVQAMTHMYGAALENTDRIRTMVLMPMTGVPESARNVTANVNVIRRLIRDAIGGE